MSKMICIKCKGSPCICHYLERLQTGAIASRIVRVAQERMQEAHPAASSCPCPHCYRVRLASWEMAR